MLFSSEYSITDFPLYISAKVVSVTPTLLNYRKLTIYNNSTSNCLGPFFAAASVWTSAIKDHLDFILIVLGN